MGPDRRFRFHDAAMRADLCARMAAAGVAHAVGPGGAVRFAAADEQGFDDAAVDVRDAAFGPFRWHVCMCEPGEVAGYVAYTAAHGIRYVRETNDDETWFLLAREHDPEEWGLW
ncbi:MAG: hypothetical protein JWO31_2403 [Phycisphaerales bacterium]|nr:hypothetical protein [Phycisphaerales bacterium]